MKKTKKKKSLKAKVAPVIQKRVAPVLKKAELNYSILEMIDEFG